MNLQEINGVKVYNLTSYQRLPEWTSRAEKRKQLKRNPSIARSFELIQELEMPDASTYVTMSPDNNYLFLLGRYKPRLRCYDLNNLAMKFERCLDYLPLKMTFLGPDYAKFALVQEERWIEVHAKGGHSFRFRIPRQGADLTFCPRSCDLIIPGVGNSIYRMNLSEGCFQTPWEAPFPNNSKYGFTSVAYDQTYNLTIAASNMGRIDGFDTRCGERVCGIDVSSYAPRPEEHEGNVGKPGLIGCTSLTYRDPLNIGVGTNEGLVHIYDIRQNRSPWHTRDTGFRTPVKTISFQNEQVLAMTNNCVKIWNAEDGKLFVGFDTGFPRLNWMHHIQNSGLIFLANESPKAMSYFIPLLGEAPLWAQNLDKVIYELDPENVSMYDGYRFITRQQLIEYGMVDLIGTNFLRAYMHGYFVSTRLLNRILKKLGLIDAKPELKEPVKAIQKTNQNSAKVEELTVDEKLENVATRDDRFAKLVHDKRYKYNQADEDVDLMRVHEARLKKKRRRKEQRQERAAYAKKLVKESGNSDQDEDEEDISNDEDDL